MILTEPSHYSQDWSGRMGSIQLLFDRERLTFYAHQS
jgi:hypothetical protein